MVRNAVRDIIPAKKIKISKQIMLGERAEGGGGEESLS